MCGVEVLVFYWAENGELWGWKIPSAGQFSRSLKLVNISGFVMQTYQKLPWVLLVKSTLQPSASQSLHAPYLPNEVHFPKAWSNTSKY